MKEAAQLNTGAMRLISAPPSTPRELDRIIQGEIQRYLATHSWRQLAAAVKEFVRKQFAPAYRLVSDEEISPEELDAEMRSHIPSRTYIEDYVKGRPICYRYINTLANFFEQEYLLRNHDPCQQYLLRFSRTSHKTE